MPHSKQDDPNLSEVKAVLERLQRISRGPNTRGLHTVNEDYAAWRPAPQPAEQSVTEVKGGPTLPLGMAAPDDPMNVPMRRVVGAVAVIATLLAAFMTIYFTQQTDSTIGPPPNDVRKDSLETAAGGAIVQSADPAATPPTPLVSETPKSRAALQAASGFMASGRVQAARAELLSVVQEGSADVAWALARSYDPNLLSTILAADASADALEASRWYRIWYDIAVKQGLVADSVSLERIIRSIH
jgi:hypothetical protein